MQRNVLLWIILMSVSGCVTSQKVAVRASCECPWPSRAEASAVDNMEEGPERDFMDRLVTHCDQHWPKDEN